MMRCGCKPVDKFAEGEEGELIVVVPSNESPSCLSEGTHTFEWLCSHEHGQVTTLCDHHAEHFPKNIEARFWACRWCLPEVNTQLRCRALPLAVDA